MLSFMIQAVTRTGGVRSVRRIRHHRVACVQTGRNFIGIEIDPGYCEIARRRIADAVPLCAEVAKLICYTEPNSFATVEAWRACDREHCRTMPIVSPFYGTNDRTGPTGGTTARRSTTGRSISSGARPLVHAGHGRPAGARDDVVCRQSVYRRAPPSSSATGSRSTSTCCSKAIGAVRSGSCSPTTRIGLFRRRRSIGRGPTSGRCARPNRVEPGVWFSWWASLFALLLADRAGRATTSPPRDAAVASRTIEYNGPRFILWTPRQPAARRGGQWAIVPENEANLWLERMVFRAMARGCRTFGLHLPDIQTPDGRPDLDRQQRTPRLHRPNARARRKHVREGRVMAADITTLSGFQYRYTTTGFTGGVAGAVEFGSVSEERRCGERPCRPSKPVAVQLLGRQCRGIDPPPTGAMKSILQKTTGTTLNNAGIGVVLIGSAACGTDGLRRQGDRDVRSRTTGHAWYGMTANGLTRSAATATRARVTARVPCGRTCLIWRHRLRDLPRVPGTDAVVTGDIFGGETPGGPTLCTSAVTRTVHLSPVGWARMSGRVVLHVGHVRASPRRSRRTRPRTWASRPHEGARICLGDSYGNAARMGGSRIFRVRAGRAGFARLVRRQQLPWRVQDRGHLHQPRDADRRGGRSPAGSYQAALFIIDAGRNDPLNNRTQSQMQTDMETLVPTRATTYPTCGIVVARTTRRA